MKSIFVRYCIIVIIFFGVFCQKDSSSTKSSNESTITRDTLSQFISGNSHGVVPRNNTIKIWFKKTMVDTSELRKEQDDDIIQISPSVKGVLRWESKKLLTFTPSELLEHNKEYTITLRGKELDNLIDSYVLNDHEFKIRTVPQGIDVTIDGLSPYSRTNLSTQQLRGTITTADYADSSALKKILTIKHKKKKFPIRWSHNRRFTEHTFTVDSILRTKEEDSVYVEWDGKSIGVNEKGVESYVVPSRTDFKIISVAGTDSDGPCVVVRFSDPLKRNQNLSGLVRLNSRTNVRTVIENNVLRVYANTNPHGDVPIWISKNVRNSEGTVMKREFNGQVSFDEQKPAVEFLGKGSIFPTSHGLSVPIKTINLHAVVVEVTQVKHSNMTQFLQVNSLKGQKELRRTGRVIWKKEVKIDLTPDKYNTWITSALDLSDLVKKYPGGMYRFTLSFKRKHIQYSCDEIFPDEDEENSSSNDEQNNENSYWDYYENSNWSENYRNRFNPCHPAYYKNISGHNIKRSRNVLISDIGVIAKKGKDNSLMVVTTNIKTSEPMKKCSVFVFNYQQELIGQGETDQQGFLKLTYEHSLGDAQFVTVSHKKQYGYLRLMGGESNSVSKFDVGGFNIKKGLKAFIYGERDVWRPGDSLFLTMILKEQSKENIIPNGHPIIFRLENPRGQQIKKMKVLKNSTNFYTFKFKTKDDAPTGTWKGSFTVGGVTVNKDLKIATVMPNRLKIDLNFDEENESGLSQGEVSGKLFSQWLHGAKASNLNTTIDLRFSPRPTKFRSYDLYRFDDLARSFKPEQRVFLNSSLDDDGNLKFTEEISVEEGSAGMMNAIFTTKVFEPGGAFSTYRKSVPYHPYDQYVGLQLPKGDRARGMLLTDTTHYANIVLVDKKGKKVKSGSVRLTIRQINWRWWWEKGYESLSQYVNSEGYSLVVDTTVSVVNGVAKCPFQVNYPSWGRYLIRAEDTEGNHSTSMIKYIDWPGWAGRAQKESGDGASMLMFTADKSSYNVGEEVTLTIPTSGKGRALISIENGTTVVKSFWAESKGKQIQHQFKVTDKMSPNVFVHVTYLQPHLTSGNDRPIRLYGVIPIDVKDPKTILKPKIVCDSVFEPKSSVTVTVSEAEKNDMTYTLAVVDEGLLGLTGFATPNPHKEFFQREALGVTTWDIFDEVVNAYNGKLEQLLAIGGDAEGKKDEEKKSNRFPPMVRFYGPFTLEKGKEKKHVVDIPQYIGAVRVMVVGGNSNAYGGVSKTVRVKKPVMVLGTLPRVLSIKERVEFPVSVFVLDENIKDISATVTCEGALSVAGSATKNVTFNRVGDKIINFTLNCSDTTGIGYVTVEVKGGKHRSTHKIEIDVRNPTQYITKTFPSVLNANAIHNTTIPLHGHEGTNSVELEISRVAPLNLGKRLDYLIRYPHGCVEQTTSGAFPQIYLPKFLDMSMEKVNVIKTNVHGGIERLRQFQTNRGGFGYWPGSPSVSEWGSLYAGHFIIEAKRAGYRVPSYMISRWTKYEKKQARIWGTFTKESSFKQAYRLYILALSGEIVMSAMNRLKESGTLSPVSKWRLAAAYSLAGQKNAAKELIKGVSWKSMKEYKKSGSTFGSLLRDQAMVLEAMTLVDENRVSKELVEEISKSLGGNRWYSTQSTAYALVGMAAYMGVGQGNSSVTTLSYSVNDEKPQKISTNKVIVQVPVDVDDRTGKMTLSLVNESDAKVYVRTIVRGQAQYGREETQSNGLKLSVNYFNTAGESIYLEDLKQGDEFKARVKVTYEGQNHDPDTLHNIALSHIFPSGWEITSDRLAKKGKDSSKTDYEDIRDDRILRYFSLRKGRSVTFETSLNSTYKGKFYVPMIHAEAMYRGTVNGTIKGLWVTIGH